LRSRDFGDDRFGQTVNRPRNVGRRVDLMARAIPVPRRAGLVTAIRQYLELGRTRTARLLAQKAVIVLQPARLRGSVVWPVRPDKRTV
jgi:hypothetical protein